MNFLLVAASLLPALAILVYFYRSDRFPEPKNTIAAVAAMGSLSIIAILPLGAMLGLLRGLWNFPYGPLFFDAFVLAAFVEEFTRFLIVFAAAQTAEFDEPMDGPVYAVAAAMGFAAIENLTYVAQGGVPVAVVRAVTAVPFHATNAAIMGYLVTLGRFLPHRRREFYGLALVVPILLHGFYDVCLMVSEAGGPTAAFQGPLQLVWGLGLWFVFDVAFRLHRHLAVTQFDQALPWWVERTPFGLPNPRIDPLFRKFTGLSHLDAADLAQLGAAAARGPGLRRDRNLPPPLPGDETRFPELHVPRSGGDPRTSGTATPSNPVGSAGIQRSPSVSGGSYGPGRVFRCPNCRATVTTAFLRPGDLVRCLECGAEVPVPGRPEPS